MKQPKSSKPNERKVAKKKEMAKKVKKKEEEKSGEVLSVGFNLTKH